MDDQSNNEMSQPMKMDNGGMSNQGKYFNIDNLHYSWTTRITVNVHKNCFHSIYIVL